MFGTAIAPPPPEFRRLTHQITTDYPITRRTLYQWSQDGHLHVWKFGRKNVYDVRELEALIQPKRSA